jgi:hypothetical protein
MLLLMGFILKLRNSFWAQNNCITPKTNICLLLKQNLPFMKTWMLFVALTSFNILSAQLVDDFSDNNFTNNPTWSGDVANFSAASGQLTGAGAVAGAGYLSVSANMRDSVSWEFYVNLNLAPSTSNYMRVFLMTDAPVLSGPSNGYYLQIGENGTTDVIRLRKQTGTTFTTVFSGTGSMATNGIARGSYMQIIQGEQIMYWTVLVWKIPTIREVILEFICVILPTMHPITALMICASTRFM